MEIRIDPVFRDKIPPLTDAEFKQLEENIVADGEIREPLIVWNDTIVDGHHRWKIHLKHPEIPFKVKTMDFADKWAAIVWMCQNQIGRRNLTDEQKTYLIGKEYEARKMTVGGDRGNQYTKMASVQSGNLPKDTGKTAQKVADDHKIGYGTVIRAEQFTHGLDAADAVSPGFKEKVLTGAVKAPKSKIAAISKMPEAEQKESVQALLHGEAVKKQPETKSERQKLKENIAAIDDSMHSLNRNIEFTALEFQEEIFGIVSDFVGKVRRMQELHKDLIAIDSNRKKIIAALSEAEAAIRKERKMLK